jgi:hypothetical protein
MNEGRFNLCFALVTFLVMIGGFFYLAHRDRDVVVSILPISKERAECFEQCANYNKLRGDGRTDNCSKKCKHIK